MKSAEEREEGRREGGRKGEKKFPHVSSPKIYVTNLSRIRFGSAPNIGDPNSPRLNIIHFCKFSFGSWVSSCCVNVIKYVYRRQGAGSSCTRCFALTL